jgi:lipopolysaccharide/colanic/teichoic acid biosynthesis glycosyltransferase
MTGIWQVLGRNDISFDEMIKLDYIYVTNWSLAGDLRLLVQTAGLVARGAGGSY